MKKELLSPAGNFESLKAAVHAGCDAVYIGGKKFGARKFATNFDNETLEEAVKYCHLYDVKLYVTVNTMIYEEEMQEVLEYVGFLNKIGVDAIIVQDIGLIYEIRKQYPDLEIHASTQLHNYCQENCQILEELGVKRVVLARELSLKEINKIKTPLEKEVFIHGAICISYSGQCLFSSIVMNRSGNRGECAGMCRLPYTLEKENGEKIKTDGKYLLSPKELCTISHFQELMESDVCCFKIEGRMKSPAYVYFVTKIYRTLMDHYEKGEKVEITKEELEELQVLYNRGFTEGHLFEKKNFDLMNIKSPNHIGIPLGKVIELKNHRIKIHLERSLQQEDGIRFIEEEKGMIVNFLYNEKGLLIQNAKKGENVWIDNKIGLTKYCSVSKTTDKNLITSLENYPLKKIPITIKLTAQKHKPLKLEIKTKHHEVCLENGIIDSSINRPTTKEEIYNHLNRLGNTPYSLKEVDIQLENNVFIPMSLLNDLRRNAIEELNHIRCVRNCGGILKKQERKIEKKKEKNVKLSCLVRTEEQLKTCLKNNIEKIYVTDINIYQKYKENYHNIFFRLERIHPTFRENTSTIATELAQLKNPTHPYITDYYLNVANTSYLKFLEENGIKCATLSIELKPEQIYHLTKNNPTTLELEIIIYGRVELMIMNHCLLNMLVHKEKTKCNACKENYYLIDRNQEKYPILVNSRITHLMSSKKDWFTISELKTLVTSGIDYMRIEFFEETEEEVTNILEKYQHILQNNKNYDKILV